MKVDFPESKPLTGTTFVSELSGLGRILPNPHLLIAPWVRREAVLSSRIEGTRASLSDLLIDELAEKRSADQDLLEVRNYVAALEYGIKVLKEANISMGGVTAVDYEVVSLHEVRHRAGEEHDRACDFIGLAVAACG